MILIHKKNRSNVSNFTILKITTNICWTLSSILFNTELLSLVKTENKTYLSFWNCWAGEANSDMFFFSHKFSVIFSAITEKMIVFFFWREKQSCFSFPAFPSELVISRRKFVKLQQSNLQTTQFFQKLVNTDLIVYFFWRGRKLDFQTESFSSSPPLVISRK